MPTPTRMLFVSDDQRGAVRAITRIVYCNPFLPERIALEREALGGAFESGAGDWNIHGERIDEDPNVARLLVQAEKFAAELAPRAGAGAAASESDAELYEDLAIFVLYHRYAPHLRPLAGPGAKGRASALYGRFEHEAAVLLSGSRGDLPARRELPHLFACFFQTRCAFDQIFRNLIGASRPAARFRAAVWQSIFTHDLRRYRRVLHARMADFTTLVTGPSGTGKELAARAIGMARYVPFDPRAGAFKADPDAAFFPLNLSALSPTLIESELFGHKRGAFTGALADRLGWMQLCPEHGAVFLDEIGELDPLLQVKLLRVLQTRTFQRVGDSRDIPFVGKIIAATNRDLGAERGKGRFRDDLYYRLCSDIITAPSLREQLSDSPGELRRLIAFVLDRIVGPESPAFIDEAERTVLETVGAEYAWPGNFRELEQCLRNILVRRVYTPPAAEPGTGGDSLLDGVASGSLSADELLRLYSARVYGQTGSYSEAARRLGLDRRTVKRFASGAADTGNTG